MAGSDMGTRTFLLLAATFVSLPSLGADQEDLVLHLGFDEGSGALASDELTCANPGLGVSSDLSGRRGQMIGMQWACSE